MRWDKSYIRSWAGNLFTAHGSDRPDRISDTYFSAERLQIPDDSDCPAGEPNSSIDSRLPNFSHEEVGTVTETPRLQGIILLDHQFSHVGPRHQLISLLLHV